MTGIIGKNYFIVGSYNYNETSGLFEGEFTLEPCNVFVSKITDTNPELIDCEMFGKFRDQYSEKVILRQMQLFKIAQGKEKHTSMYNLERKLTHEFEDISGEYIGKWINAKNAKPRIEGTKLFVTYEEKDNSNEVKLIISDDKNTIINAKKRLESILAKHAYDSSSTPSNLLRPDFLQN